MEITRIIPKKDAFAIIPSEELLRITWLKWAFPLRKYMFTGRTRAAIRDMAATGFRIVLSPNCFWAGKP
ncbi:hypothetical protein HZA42_03805 [Candidatus Peregrinibacteria bacterium]|nr:hypothetical protein [Candidatus Peregrinibacteria bacterium]